MGTYVASSAEIVPRIGNRPITANTVPSTTQVGNWIDEAEAELLGLLASLGIPTSYSSGTTGFKILRGWIGDYIAAQVRASHAAAAGDGANDDGQDGIDRWDARQRDIKIRPDTYQGMLSGGATASSGVSLQSHVTDSTLTLTTAAKASNVTFNGDNF